jgi:hypothetical protein
MASWREGHKTRNFHLGSASKMDAEAARQKAKMNTNAASSRLLVSPRTSNSSYPPDVLGRVALTIITPRIFILPVSRRPK